MTVVTHLSQPPLTWSTPGSSVLAYLFSLSLYFISFLVPALGRFCYLCILVLSILVGFL